jgi:hypothetical protein
MNHVLPLFDVFIFAANVVALIAIGIFSSYHTAKFERQLSIYWYGSYSIAMILLCGTLGVRLLYAYAVNEHTLPYPSSLDNPERVHIQEYRTVAIWHMSIPFTMLFFLPLDYESTFFKLKMIDFSALVYVVSIVASVCVANTPLAIISSSILILDIVVYQYAHITVKCRTQFISGAWTLILSIATVCSVINETSCAFDVLELCFIIGLIALQLVFDFKLDQTHVRWTTITEKLNSLLLGLIILSFGTCLVNLFIIPKYSGQ